MVSGTSPTRAVRLATGIWVAAKLRQISAMGGFGAIIHKGDEAAGTVLLQWRGKGGALFLAGPAPQTEFADPSAETDSRRFEWRLRVTSSHDIDALVARELKFDRDLWLIEVECGGDDFEAVFGLKPE
jgi:hypothetical protein